MVGNFDGVHRGHQALIQLSRSVAADLQCPVVAMTFEPHPLAILRPAAAPARLTTAGERAALLAHHGVDTLIVLTADRDLLETPAEVFFEKTMLRCRPRAMVEGPTFNFGRGRSGSVDSLRDLARRHRFAFHLCDELRCTELADQPAINSTAVRAALRHGQIGRARAMLGRPHRLVGRVVRGEGRGATLGYATANLDDIAQMLPASCVVAAIAQLDDDSLHAAAVNIGPQPTFAQPGVRVEAHLIDFDGDLCGRQLGLHLLSALREPRRFETAYDLADQLRRDVQVVRQHVGPSPAACLGPLIALDP